MTSIKILDDVSNPTIDGFVIQNCLIPGCDCDLCLSYPNSSRPMEHKHIGDILTIGTKEQCKDGTKDIIQIVADGFIDLGWAEEI